MSLDDFVSVTVTTAAANPSVPGFNIPLVLVQKLPAGWVVGRVRTYSDTASMLTDGWAITDDGYLAVAEAFAQTPRPPFVKVGARRTNKTTQIVKLKCLSAVTGDVYRITIATPAGVSTVITYTVPGASTTTTVATAILALINAVSGFAGSTSAVDTITIASPTAGTLNRYRNWTSNFNFSDQSADGGIAADLNAVYAEDPNFSGFDIDSHSKAENLGAAAWAESNKKMFVPQSCDSDVGDVAVTTDVASTIVTNAYRYTFMLYNGNDTKAFAGFGLLCGRYAACPIPGNETLALKSIAGVATDALPQAFINAATAASKRATVYVLQNSVAVTQSGVNGQMGSGEWADVVRGVDWLATSVQIRLFARMVNAPKVAYTDAGADSLAGTVEAVEREAVGYSILDSFTTPAGPKVATIDATTRGQRSYGPITGSARLSGAIHKASVSLSVTP
jgi:hypothetical protein